MKARWIPLICLLLLLPSCASRSSAPAAPAQASVLEEESDAPSKSQESPPPSQPEESTAPEQDESEDEAIPAPILTDTEKEMLAANIALFAQFIGPAQVASPEALSKDAVLDAVLAEIERTKDFNAYLFEQDANGNDMIHVTLVADTAMRLFGLPEFTHTESAAYDSGKECYLGKPVELADVEMSDIAGAPDDNVVYTVTFPDGNFRYTAKILRQNGMPYLRFVSSEKL